MFMQSAAAATATTGQSFTELSLGASLTLIGTVLAVGAALIKFGEIKAEVRFMKTQGEEKMKALEEGVTKELADIKRQLGEILTFIHDSQQHRVDLAGWQERTTANVTTALKDADNAKTTAHAVRNTLMEHAFKRGGE